MNSSTSKNENSIQNISSFSQTSGNSTPAPQIRNQQIQHSRISSEDEKEYDPFNIRNNSQRETEFFAL